MESVVIVPTYNEIDNITTVINKLTALNLDLHILVIDDNSPDGTADIVKNLQIKNEHIFIIERPGKLGLGTAYIRGFHWALERGYKYILEMDADLRGKLLANPRAKELAAMKTEASQEMSLAEARAKFGGAGVSDEDMLLRAIMQGDQEIEAMRGAGPARQYLGAGQPLKTLMAELEKHKNVRFIQVSRGSDALTLRGASRA